MNKLKFLEEIKMKGVTFQTGGPSAHLEITYAHPNVLCGGSPGRVRDMASYLNNAEIIESRRGLVTVHGDYKGTPITAFSTGMGSASVSITMPEIIEAYEGKKMAFLRLGTSGGLHPDTRVGDFVITTTVDRHESTSDKIMGEGYVARASPEAIETLRSAATEMAMPGQQVHVGPTMVTDDLYFFNQELQERYAGNEELRRKEIPDVLAVSMEFSVLCALRDRYNRDFEKEIKTGNLLTVSDLPFSTEERVDQSDFLGSMARIEDAQIRAGLETLVELSQQR